MSLYSVEVRANVHQRVSRLCLSLCIRLFGRCEVCKTATKNRTLGKMQVRVHVSQKEMTHVMQAVRIPQRPRTRICPVPSRRDPAMLSQMVYHLAYPVPNTISTCSVAHGVLRYVPNSFFMCGQKQLVDPANSGESAARTTSTSIKEGGCKYRMTRTRNAIKICGDACAWMPHMRVREPCQYRCCSVLFVRSVVWVVQVDWPARAIAWCYSWVFKDSLDLASKVQSVA